MKLSKFTFLLSSFACLLSANGALAQGQGSEPTLTDSTVKIIEERTVIERRKVYEAENSQPRKTAIFVDNRSGPQLNDKILFLEDQVASRASGKNFQIISREDVLKAVKVYRGSSVVAVSSGAEVKTESGLSRPTTESVSASAVQSAVISDAERNTLGTKLDQSLSDNSSALRMAQNMGADFVLFVAIGSFGKETKSFEDPSLGVKTKNLVYNLRGTFKVVEGVTGSALGGDAFKVSKTIRQTATLQTDNEDLVNELLEEAAEKIVAGLSSKAQRFNPATVPGKVEIAIACGIKDLAGNEISLPDIRITEDNKIVKGDKELVAQASATIEIDGFAMGTTPAKIKVSPGAHKLRLTRPGFDDVELHINATEGLSLSPTMQLSEAGFERWKEVRAFLNALDITRKISDAKAEEIRGRAQMLRQSGFLVDYRVNTTQGTPLVKNHSIYKID